MIPEFFCEDYFWKKERKKEMKRNFETVSLQEKDFASRKVVQELNFLYGFVMKKQFVV